MSKKLRTWEKQVKGPQADDPNPRCSACGELIDVEFDDEGNRKEILVFLHLPDGTPNEVEICQLCSHSMLSGSRMVRSRKLENFSENIRKLLDGSLEEITNVEGRLKNLKKIFFGWIDESDDQT